MASINGELGYSVRLYSGGNAIGGEVGISFGVSTNMADMNTKDNTDWVEIRPLRKTFTCSANGKIDTGDTGYNEIQDKSFDNTLATMLIKTFNATRQYSFSAYISEFNHDGPHDGPLTWTCTVAPTGPVLEEAVA
jgi:hypothetical protein